MLEIKNDFDVVHDAQRVFRLLLEAMAKPGTIVDLNFTGTGNPLHHVAAALAFTLLDTEVAFAVCLDDAEPLVAWIKRMTLSRMAPIVEADYIFADGREKAENPLWGRLTDRTSLVQPEAVATLFLVVEHIGTEPGSSSLAYLLQGPGIKDRRTLYVQGLEPAWLELRSVWNREYPVGIDWVLYTPAGTMACLPRATKVQQQ